MKTWITIDKMFSGAPCEEIQEYSKMTKVKIQCVDYCNSCLHMWTTLDSGIFLLDRKINNQPYLNDIWIGKRLLKKLLNLN